MSQRSPRRQLALTIVCPPRVSPPANSNTAFHHTRQARHHVHVRHPISSAVRRRALELTVTRLVRATRVRDRGFKIYEFITIRHKNMTAILKNNTI